MNSIPIIFPEKFADYELLDSGDGEKLERFGSYTVSRPDPRAIWQKNNEDNWKNADASHERLDNKTGAWHTRRPFPTPWIIRYKDLSFSLTANEFKHVGIFPEQAVNWDFLRNTIQNKPLKILNLFASSGGATVACIKSGAHVTHVDASKSSLDLANKNIQLNNLPQTQVRFILEDCLKFVDREIRRQTTYDAVILDPPKFGRGTQGEIWKLEEHLAEVLVKVKLLLPHPQFVILNTYTADLSSLAIHNLMQDVFADLHSRVETFELTLKESERERYLPSGILSRLIVTS